MHTVHGGAAAVPRPRIVPPSADTSEARLAALEGQRTVDHHVMEMLVAAVNMLQVKTTQQDESIGAITASGLALRQEIFAVRSELAAGVAVATDAAQNTAMAQMAISVEAKFAALDSLTEQLVSGVQFLGAREQRVEEVVEKDVEHGAKNEGIINDAFNQLDAKISRVDQKLNKLRQRVDSFHWCRLSGLLAHLSWVVY